LCLPAGLRAGCADAPIALSCSMPGAPPPADIRPCVGKGLVSVAAAASSMSWLIPCSFTVPTCTRSSEQLTGTGPLHATRTGCCWQSCLACAACFWSFVVSWHYYTCIKMQRQHQHTTNGVTLGMKATVVGQNCRVCSAQMLCRPPSSPACHQASRDLGHWASEASGAIRTLSTGCGTCSSQAGVGNSSTQHASRQGDSNPRCMLKTAKVHCQKKPQGC
jgi:hypothetical protein